MGRGADASQSLVSRPPAPSLSKGFQDSDIGFSTSKLMAMEVAELTTDPELEEAAIRFANGDDAGAENGLLLALRGEVLLPDSALSWAAALFDFYRATGRRDAFDRAMEEFGGRFDNLVPQWVAIGATHGASVTAAQSSTPVPSQSSLRRPVALWSCPAELTVQAMEELRDVLSNNGMPWHLDWSAMDQIAADAMPLLAGLFSSLCSEPVSLQFSGSEQLIQTLRSLTPSGNKSIDTSHWAVRLDVLRTLRMQDEFELAALDYCVTYEVSPPAWQEAKCQCENMNAAPSTAPMGVDRSAATVPMGLDAGPAFTVELEGEVLGDATEALSSAEMHGDTGTRIVVSCRNLVRVDFSAAGSILNWVAKRQAQGQSVQFREVHRLVAAFFNVIGINEHARVVPRPM
jgi:anti-anti-sigma regulatory factor